LDDGTNTYTYDSANRLISVNGTTTYQYNGLGDRIISQTVNPSTGSGQVVTTNYTLDLNTGLTQVLSDGTTEYLYGNGRIAQVNTSAEYFPSTSSGRRLGDALGSVRQMTDPNGAITYARNYDPYGVVTYTTGASQTEFGFTGEQYDTYIKLIYLRARHYSPADGRFTSRDTWSGDVNRPLSLNRWMYVEGNPVNLTDPSGYIPAFPNDHRNLTSWLVREMRVNANDPKVRRIAELNQLARQVLWATPVSPSTAHSLSIILKGIAMYEWKELVKDGARWDFKDQIASEFVGNPQGPAPIVLCYIGGCEWFEYSVPGNIHYGYVGRAAGFSQQILHAGASVAEITDPAHRELIEMLGKWFVNLHVDVNCLIDFKLDLYVNLEWWDAGFDDPTDFAAVDLGSRLFSQAEFNVTLGSFQNLLQTNSSRLAHMPEPTTLYFNPSWPYPLRYFDGGR
jgi:RHS repeat-associated protein